MTRADFEHIEELFSYSVFINQLSFRRKYTISSLLERQMFIFLNSPIHIVARQAYGISNAIILVNWMYVQRIVHLFIHTRVNILGEYVCGAYKLKET